MPCQKCEDNKWKWGVNGMCGYNSEQECIDANEGREEYTTDIVELIIDENSEDLSIDAISIVTAPAIEVDFVYFNIEAGVNFLILYFTLFLQTNQV